MRTHLMAGTALVAATMLAAGGAAAQDKKMKAMAPSISVGGFYNVIVGGFLDEADETGNQDNTVDTSALDVRTNGEVHFNGSATLDNGIKVATRVELEGQNNHSHASAGGDPIDHYFLSVSGTFGQIVIGGLPGAAAMIGSYSGTGTGVGAHMHFDNWVTNAGKADTYIVVGDVDSEKITYVSPKLGGVQIGMSYSPEVDEKTGNARVNAEDNPHDGLEGMARYSGTFGDVGFGVGASMRTVQGANNGGMDQSRWSVGGYVDFGGGFRVAAAHKRNEDDNEAANGQTTDAGVRYAVGANKFSLIGVLAELDNSDDRRTTVIGSYARTMGPGVAAHADLVWSESEGPTNADGSQRTYNGLVMLTGIKVKF